MKAGTLRTIKDCIDSIVHYASVYDAVMRRDRREVRESAGPQEVGVQTQD